MLGSDAHPTNVGCTQNNAQAGCGLQSKAPLFIGGVPSLTGPCRSAEPKIAFSGDADEIHPVGVLEIEGPPRPVELGVWRVDGAVNEPADLMNGMGDFVFQVVPSCADPQVSWDSNSISDFAADPRIELWNGKSRRVQVNLGVKCCRHVGGLDVVEGEVDTRTHEMKVRFAVLSAVVPPMRVPFAMGFGPVDPPNGLAHGAAAGLAVHRRGGAEQADR